MNEYGKRIWFFPDGDRPPFGDSPLKGHESIVVLNPNKGQAVIKITFYYEDREPVTTDEIVVEAERVCCMKTHEEKYFKDKTQLTGTQYALKVEGSIPVIVQYGRLDSRQTNLAYYTVMGYATD
jgi:hypothetical protein